MTGIRATDNSDEAEALMRGDPDPPVTLSGPAMRQLRKRLAAARAGLAPHSLRGSHRTMTAVREAVCEIVMAEALIAGAASVPVPEPHATPDTPGD